MFCVFYVAKMFLEKIWICPDCFNYYTTDMYPPQLPYEEFIFHQFLCLHALIFICENLPLWLSVRIFSFRQESFLIYDHLWESLLFCENFFEPLLSVRISRYLWLSICENLLEHLFVSLNLCENKQAYE